MKREQRLKIQKYKDLSKTIVKKVLKYNSVGRAHRRFLPKKAYLKACKEKVDKLEYKPLISVILPTHNTPDAFLKACVDSILNQIYPNLELCIADDCSSSKNVEKIVKEYAKKDSRVKYTFLKDHAHIVGSTNEAIKISNGEFLAFIDHDDLLTENALYEVVKALQTKRDADVLYSNEDKIDTYNNLSEPCFKPAFDLEYFLSFMYLGHLSVYRKEVVESVGLLRKGTEGSQDYDLALRVFEKTQNVVHIPKILYHWRKHENSVALTPDAKPYAYKAMKKVLEEGLQRRSKDGAWLEETREMGVNRPRYKVKDSKNILAVIFRDQKSYAKRPIKLKSKLHNIIYCTNQGRNPSIDEVDFVSNKKNFSKYFVECLEKFPKVDYVLCLDHNLEVKDTFIDEIVEQAVRPEIAAVTCKIENHKKHCVHGGYTLYNKKLKNNFYGFETNTYVPGSRLTVQRSVSITSLKATLLKKEFLDQINFDSATYRSRESFEIALSLELSKTKGRVIWTPFIKAKLRNKSSLFDCLDLEDKTIDYLKLNKVYSISEYKDPYYPLGFSTKTLNFNYA